MPHLTNTVFGLRPTDGSDLDFLETVFIKQLLPKELRLLFNQRYQNNSFQFSDGLENIACLDGILEGIVDIH